MLLTLWPFLTSVLSDLEVGADITGNTPAMFYFETGENITRWVLSVVVIDG